jgi:glycosyltransferase involved in cell wall biosynthesis
MALNSGVPQAIGLSIIIPARNSSRFIEECLTAIRERVPGDRSEVIVVDNGSLDDTVAKARSHGARIVSVPSGFVSAVRNSGARAARYPMLAFVDSDCAVRPGWFEAVTAALSDPSIGVTGRRHELPDNPTWVESVWQSAHRMPMEDGPTDVAYIPAGNMAVRSEVFSSVGGFDESLETGEDPDLCARIAASGLRVVQDASIRCVHLGEPKTLRDVFRRERWHGRGARFRYADGRHAPVTYATATIGGWLIAAPAISYMVGADAVQAAILLVAAPVLIPVIYAVRCVGIRRPARLVRLSAVYVAYFAGRVAAFPVAMSRMLGGK